MKIQNSIISIFITACFICAYSAPVNNSKVKKQKQAVISVSPADEIFDDIMESLPSSVKAKIDDVKKSPPERIKSNQVTKPKATGDKKPKPGEIKHNSDMPKELKPKVEKAMNDIEKKKEKRQLQFKENKKK